MSFLLFAVTGVGVAWQLWGFWACVVGAGVAAWAWVVYNAPTPPPTSVTHPYARPSLLYPLKVFVFYCLVKLRKRGGGGEGAGYGARSHANTDLMEQPQPLADNPKAIDAVFFSGSSSSSGWGVILAMERRPRGLTNTLVYLRVPGVGLLVSPAHPDTIAFRTAEDEGVFRAGGVTITPVTPMKEWRLEYKGKLRRHGESGGREVGVEVSLRWTSDLPHFDFDADMDVMTTARAFAREPWTRQYFQQLRQHHQTHYEQMGRLVGTATLDGTSHALDMPSFRDHSYGARREWLLMHRYVFHHVFLDDGSMGVVGVVCQPSTCSRLVLGHWWGAGAKYGAQGQGAPVTHVDLALHQHGEGGTPPTQYAFTFTAGGVQRLMEVQVEEAPVHYNGWDWEACMVETWVSYRVNGVRGVGVTEWNYRHTEGRPAHVTDRDPAHTHAHRQEYLAA